MRYSLPRRRRLGDPLASPKKIEQLLDQLVRRLGSQLSSYIDLKSVESGNYDPVVQLLQAASNYVRAQSNMALRSSKPSRFSKSLLASVVETMSRILNRESQGRISFRTFTDNNLRLLSCPDDLKDMLEQGRITLFEALQLKRLGPESLSLDPEQAVTVRAEFIARCRRERWIAHRLRHEIDVKLGKRVESSPHLQAISLAQQEENIIEGESDLTSTLPSVDRDSLFVEQIILMIEMLQAIDPAALERPELDRLLNCVDEVLLQLQRIHRRQRPNPSAKRTPALGFI
jgi:hypothetical protein